jgi:apurinic endonuclease APN1
MILGACIVDKYYKNIKQSFTIAKKIKANIIQLYLGDKRLTTLRKKIVLTKNEIDEINEITKKNNINLIIHGILTLNFCNDPKSPRYRWGIDNVVYDMNLSHKLNALGVIIHMGTFKTEKIDLPKSVCIQNYIQSICIILDETKSIPLILETPVQKPNKIGGYLEDFAHIYNSIPEKYKHRVKCCIDTQHIFASGYDISNLENTIDYFNKFDNLIGVKNIALIHLNDSQSEFNSHVNRHAPIETGYLFLKKSESLKFIINYANKNNIPIILETDFENFASEIKYLKSLIVSESKSISKPTLKYNDIKNTILIIFKSILRFHESLGSNANISTKYRINSYIKAIKSIESYDKPIYSSKDVKDLPHIGKGFCEKIDEIAKTGTLEFYESLKKNNNIKRINAIHNFMNIWGVGTKKAHSIVNKKIYSINELKKALNTKKNIKLSTQQKLGLKYYNNLKKKIPRKEILEYTNYLKKLFKKYNFIKIHNAGSYRISKSESGDIDLILTFDDTKNKIHIKKKIIKKLFFTVMNKNNLIIDILSSGKDKTIFITKCKNINNHNHNHNYNHNKKIFRKVDIAIIKESDLPWYLLYFGSSKDFSKKIRIIASKKGYKLTEKGLFNKISGKKINFKPKTEKDIFKYLEIDYIEPKNR